MRTIAHLSDLHFGRVDEKVCGALLDDLHELSPALVAVSGDLTQGAGVHQFHAAARFLEALPGPWLAVPGSRDIPLYDVVSRALSPFWRFRKYVSTDLNPVFVDEEMMVLGINTARSMTSRSGRVAEEQIARVRERLRHEPKDRQLFKVLVMHHPLVPTGGTPSAALAHRGELALAPLEKWGADLLLAGHLHHPPGVDVRAHHVSIRGSILVAQTETAIDTGYRREPHGYNFISLEKGWVSIEQRDFDGTRFVPSEVVRYRCEGGEWRVTGVETVTAEASFSVPLP